MRIREKLIPIATVLATILYPCLFLYFQNAGEASLLDISGVTAALVSSGVLLLGICFLVVKNMEKAALVTALGMLLFLNFAFLEQALMLIHLKLYYWHTALILIFVWVNLFLLIAKKMSDSVVHLINVVITLVFTALILINGVTAAPTIVNKIAKGGRQQAGDIQVQQAEQSPNIYYFIFDEYGGIENLQRYCNYDNSPFYGQLRELGFNISEDSYNESSATATVVPNLMNLDYVNSGGESADEEENALRKAKMKSPYLFRLLLKQGYGINILDKSDFLDRSQCTYSYDLNNSKNQSVEGSAAYYILQSTALYPFYRDSGSADLEALQSMVEYAKYSATLEPSNLFTVGYFCYPHVPWFVDENGHPISGADRINYANTDIYLGQLKYGNKLIIEITNAILKNDPDCIIILQSDHGFRWPNAGLVKFEDWETEYSYMRNILNAVYYRGEQLEIEGLSGINTLRTIINRLFDSDMPLIDPSTYR